MQTELKTILDWIRWGASQFKAHHLFFGHGTDNAWDEAVYLVLHTLHLPQDSQPVILQARLTTDEKQAVYTVLHRRFTSRLPAPYLTREAWFAGLPFYVDERVLIPRSPLAELIQQQFSPWIEEDRVSRILDLCTGSACIAIACAQAFPEAEITASDLSAEALIVAKKNVEKFHLNAQVALRQSNLFSALENQTFDIIISNPPYVDAQDMGALPPEYLHEPTLALAAGEDGLEIVETILHTAAQHLTPKGILIVEVGNSAEALIQKYPRIPFIWLEFEHGDSDVFLLTKENLVEASIFLNANPK